MNHQPQRQPKPPPEATEQGRVFALVGNPNCGKTTLFNALTGLRQKVGNYAGVTVDCKMGEAFGLHGERFQIIDLPGAYSLAARSPDEAVMQDVLLGRRLDVPPVDAIICVLDATILERGLYLATQVLEIGLPVILVLKMLDVAREKGVKIDAEALSKKLGVLVVESEGESAPSVRALRIAMSKSVLPVSPWRRHETEHFDACEKELAGLLENLCRCKEGACGHPRRRDADSDAAKRRRLVCARMMITGDAPAYPRTQVAPLPSEAQQLAQRMGAALDAEHPHWREDRIAERYAAIGHILDGVVRHRSDGPTLTDRIDRVVLHPVWCWGVLAAVLGVVFYSVFWLAQWPMEGIEWLFNELSAFLEGILPAGVLTDLLLDGVLAGVGAVLIFLPQILLLFFFLALLESTGYLSRATFILDRVMGVFGLHGRSFIPLLSGFACAVPGIMATRTIESSRDRLATILILPWMSCSARLPVYLLLIAAVYPETGPWATLQKTLLLLFLYFLGIVSAMAASWLWSKTIARRERSSFVMELPLYHRPHWKQVALELWDKCSTFLRNAGTIILAMAVVLWALLNYPLHPEASPSEQMQKSYAGQLGKWIEPAIEPLGFNWKVGVGLIASFGAREVFVSTMNIIHNVETSDVAAEKNEQMEHLERNFGPAAVVQVHELQEQPMRGGYGLSPLTCVSLMVFYVYALQCMSTLAVVGRETRSLKWPLFMLFYMTGTAYLASLAVYQIGRLLGFS